MDSFYLCNFRKVNGGKLTVIPALPLFLLHLNSFVLLFLWYQRVQT